MYPHPSAHHSFHLITTSRALSFEMLLQWSKKDGSHWMQGLGCMVDGQHVLSETGPEVFL
jgi:hypothetical protein